MDISDLAERLSSGRLFHAYIVTGADAGERRAAGELIARAAVCQADHGVPCGVCRDCVKAKKGIHPDIATVTREKDAALINVETARDLRARAAQIPGEARRSVFIVEDADFMNPQAQNALLKVLEEPPEFAVFVLLADNPQRLLETVRSRCETVSLNPGLAELSEKARDAAREVFAAYLAGDRLGLVRAVQPMEKLVKNELFDMMNALRRETLAHAGELSRAQAERLCEAADGGDKMINANIKGGNLAGWLLSELLVP